MPPRDCRRCELKLSRKPHFTLTAISEIPLFRAINGFRITILFMGRLCLIIKRKTPELMVLRFKALYYVQIFTKYEVALIQFNFTNI